MARWKAGQFKKAQFLNRHFFIIHFTDHVFKYKSGESYVKTLEQKGYVVYCFDFCGGGGSRSDGSALDMFIFTEQSDLEGVLDMLKKQSFVDTNNIVLLGASQGGVVPAITGAEHTEEIRGLVLLYPAFVLVNDAKERFQSVEDIPEQYFHMWMTIVIAVNAWFINIKTGCRTCLCCMVESGS